MGDFLWARTLQGLFCRQWRFELPDLPGAVSGESSPCKCHWEHLALNIVHSLPLSKSILGCFHLGLCFLCCLGVKVSVCGPLGLPSWVTAQHLNHSNEGTEDGLRLTPQTLLIRSKGNLNENCTLGRMSKVSSVNHFTGQPPHLAQAEKHPPPIHQVVVYGFYSVILPSCHLCFWAQGTVSTAGGGFVDAPSL